MRDKSEKFKEIAGKRTIRVLDDLRLLGQCSNKSHYEYTPEQVDKIFREIKKALRITERKFSRSSRKIDFKL